MVQKVISFAVLVSTIAQGATSPPILLKWMGSKPTNCHFLVERFLTELRSIATDRIIELEAFESSGPASVFQEQPRILELRCLANASQTLELSDGSKTFVLRYLAKASGFDASDWLPVQRHFLRPFSLAPVEHDSDLLKSEQTFSAISKSEVIAPFYQKWWFWTLLGCGAGAGVYLFTQKSQETDRIRVEIR